MSRYGGATLYILTKAWQVKAVEAVELPARLGYYQVGKRVYNHADLFGSASQAIEEGERRLAAQRAEVVRRSVELDRREGYLRIARGRLRQGD